MYSFIFLTCDNCNERFDYEFTFGCMSEDGIIETNCPNCESIIRIVHTITFANGDCGLEVENATRGLFVTIE